MPIDDILLETEEHMEKAIEHLQHELRGIRTGRASPGLIEHVKVDYYGTPTDLRNISNISVPEGNQLLVRPFSPQDVGAILRAINDSKLGLNPQSDGKQIRITLPPMSMDRRKQLVAQVKELGEHTKVAIRNIRRDANKHIEAEEHVSEDETNRAKAETQELTKQYEEKANDAVKKKEQDVMEV